MHGVHGGAPHLPLRGRGEGGKGDKGGGRHGPAGEVLRGRQPREGRGKREDARVKREIGGFTCSCGWKKGGLKFKKKRGVLTLSLIHI